MPNDAKVTQELKLFAPTRELLNDIKYHSETEKGYTARYIAQIDDLPIGVWNWLKQYDNPNKHCVLLCWEGKGKFCHRHLLADYLLNRFGIKVTEL